MNCGDLVLDSGIAQVHSELFVWAYRLHRLFRLAFLISAFAYILLTFSGEGVVQPPLRRRSCR
jgi:hypothetical protein